MSNETNDNGATVPCISLLADVIAFRDECRTAQIELIPQADPTGDARLAYRVCADQLTALIERHQGKTNNAELSGGEAVRSDVLFGVSVARVDGFRSVPKVNADEDMVRVTLDMPKHTWRKLQKLLPPNAEHEGQS